MTATTGSGGLSGSGNWAAGLAGAGSALVDGAGQSATQSRSAAGLPSSTALLSTARSALATAQAQQADVMLTLSSAGAQSLLASTQPGNGTNTTTSAGATAATVAGNVAEEATTGAGTTALAADVMQAADAVLNNPSATVEQKAMATHLMQVATTLGAQQGGSASASAALATGQFINQLSSQSAEQGSGLANVGGALGGALGGAVVTTSGLYGLASQAVQEGRRSMASALQGMGTAQSEEIVLPGGIVQLPQSTGNAGAAVSALAGNALSTALLPELFAALSSVLADKNATPEQKAAATALLQTFDMFDNTTQIPQALLNPLLAAVLMPAVSPSIRGRLVRAALAEEVEDMGQTEEAGQSSRSAARAGGLRAALAKNAAYLAAVQKPLLNHVFQLTQKLEAEAMEAGLAGWGTAALSREQLMEEAIQASSILAFSQNLLAESTYVGALTSTSLTSILIMSWAALLSGYLPRSYPFVPRAWRRGGKKQGRRKNRSTAMGLQNLLFMDNAQEV